jgi:hypothetical protein
VLRNLIGRHLRSGMHNERDSLFIGDRWEADASDWRSVVDPTTGEPMGRSDPRASRPFSGTRPSRSPRRLSVPTNEQQPPGSHSLVGRPNRILGRARCSIVVGRSRSASVSAPRGRHPARIR